jgi:hypothetical protein
MIMGFKRGRPAILAHRWLRLSFAAAILASVAYWFLTAPIVELTATAELSGGSVQAIYPGRGNTLACCTFAVFKIDSESCRTRDEVHFAQPVSCSARSTRRSLFATVSVLGEIRLFEIEPRIKQLAIGSPVPILGEHEFPAADAELLASVAFVSIADEEWLVASTNRFDYRIAVDNDSENPIELNAATWLSEPVVGARGERLTADLGDGRLFSFPVYSPEKPTIRDFNDGSSVIADWPTGDPTGGRIVSVTAAPDGKHIAASTTRGELLLIASDGLELAHRIPAYGPRYFSSITFAGPNQVVSYGGWYWPLRPVGVKLWSVSTGRLLDRWLLPGDDDASVITVERTSNSLLCGEVNGTLRRYALPDIVSRKNNGTTPPIGNAQP